MKLIFTCPKCGKHELGSVEQVLMTYPVTEIDLESQCIEYDSDNPTAGDGYTLSFQCVYCGWEIAESENSHSLIEQADVVKWIAENCPQNGPMTHFREILEKREERRDGS